MVAPFDDLLDELGKGCPVCHERLTAVAVRGSNDIQLSSCGHRFDPQDWLDEQAEIEASEGEGEDE